MQNSECLPGRPDLLYYTEHENDKLNKEVSSGDIVVAQDYCQNKFPFGCKQEFVKLTLIYMNELELNLPRNVQEAETLYLQLINAIYFSLL